ncbi:MAG: hypothetical protein M3297_16765, partial [Thermoproteota archaeon]|nr:hypothetical protein [Thermoproteota archaeon]
VPTLEKQDQLWQGRTYIYRKEQGGLSLRCWIRNWKQTLSGFSELFVTVYFSAGPKLYIT